MTAHFTHSQDVAAGLAEPIDASPRRVLYRNYLKRLFDISFVLATSIFVVPLVAIVSVFVMLDGHSPFYRQTRVGKDGRIFRMVKLRSMIPDADRRLAEYLRANPEARAEWNRNQKLRRDPRITSVGRFIRKCSLDELPQFWNVLVGDMSVVGPRPMLPAQRDLYPGQAYYMMRPGVTGLWQIGDRNNTSFSSRARFDSEYYARMGLFTDVSIVLKTVPVVVSGTGC